MLSKRFSCREFTGARASRRLLLAVAVMLTAMGAGFDAKAQQPQQSGRRTLLSSPAPSPAKANRRFRRRGRRMLPPFHFGTLLKGNDTKGLSATGGNVTELSPTAGAEKKIRESPQWRLNWFLFQRSFPNESLPSRGRANAFYGLTHPRTQPRPAPTPVITEQWRSVGPTPVTPSFPSMGVTSGRVSAIQISPADPQVILVGGATGGIWRSADGGNNFVPVSDNQVDLAVGSIAFAPSDPSRVYAGMGDVAGGYMGTGVLRSTDAGLSWARVTGMGLPAPGTIANIVVDPVDPNRLYITQYAYRAATGQGEIYASGLFLSEDGGESWKKTMTGLPRDLVHHPTLPRTLYMSMASTFATSHPSAGVYKSTDGGRTWRPVFKPAYMSAIDIKIAVTPSEPETIYVFTGDAEGSAGITLHVSKDGGETWSDISHGDSDLGQFGYNSYVAVDPGDAKVIYLGTRDLYKTSDGGETWSNLTKNWRKFGLEYKFTPDENTTAHTDQHVLVFSPGNPRVIYIGNDGGVSRSTDGGTTFQSLNSTLSLTQFNSVTLHPADGAKSCGGTQDNGALVRAPGLPGWTEFNSGDSGRCLMNPRDPSMLYANYIFGTIYRFRNDGMAFDGTIATEENFGESPITPRIAFYPPFAVKPSDGQLYFGTWRLFVSSNQGLEWSEPSDGKDLTKGHTSFGADVLSAIGIGPSNSNVVYTGSAQGRVMVTKDGGAKWEDVTKGLPRRFITSIVVDSADADTVYLTVSGFGSGHVFKSIDGGKRWNDISTALENIPVNALLIDPLRRTTLYAGTDVGVFRSLDDGASWHGFNRGLPPVIVTGFSAQPGGRIQVSTYGRGAYELDR